MAIPPGKRDAASQAGYVQYVHFNYVHMWMAGASAAATLTMTAIYLPTASLCAGGIAYALGRAIQLHVEQEADDSLRTMRRVREVLMKSSKPDFIARHPPKIISSEHLEHSSSVPPAPIAESIFALCFQLVTTSRSMNSMSTFLERDLLSSGISRRDANMAISFLASALDRSVWNDDVLPSSIASVLAVLRYSRRSHPRSAFYGAPMVVRVFALLGDSVLFGMIVGSFFWLDAPAVAYSTLMQNKTAVAAVLREKFRTELESQQAMSKCNTDAPPV
ncbi:uncharacterized protein C8Q71DRAFT_760186 [Rhodofomes roseus]|uniref:Uncharacterized protein n=1 Tax=Rhodofomes roseus TaxID=34475 RepID=A0ABQ8KGD9_9APHY|nr:uncharacterized protein C8Q71DRAFT_760186 [Rhodofomes roseus]KAH9836850.1 hypothetical protein C8Q71DRAFT_760186 [Rhodofomes roseus]